MTGNPWDHGIPHVNPGDVMSFVGLDGVVRTHRVRVSQASYTGAQPATRIHPTGWRKFVRALTPPRWRKPLPVKPPTLPTISFRTDDPFWRVSK